MTRISCITLYMCNNTLVLTQRLSCCYRCAGVIQRGVNRKVCETASNSPKRYSRLSQYSPSCMPSCMAAPSHETGWAIRQPQTPHGLDQRRNEMQPSSDGARQNERKSINAQQEFATLDCYWERTANPWPMIRQPCLYALPGSQRRPGRIKVRRYPA